MKYVNKIFIWLIFLLILYLSYKDKSYVRMKNQAQRELVDEVIDFEPDWVLDSLKGPIIKERIPGYVTFTWYNKVAYNDTATINVHINKSNCVLFGTKVSSNYQTEYWKGAKANFNDLLPSGYALISTHSECFIDSFKIANNKFFDKSEYPFFTESKESLFYDFEHGYFELLRKQDNLSLVQFYKPVADFFPKDSSRFNWTMKCKVLLDTKEKLIHLEPYREKKYNTQWP